MNVKFLIALALSFAGVLFFAENLRAQKLVSGGKPKKSDVKGFDESYCVNLPNKFQVCKAANRESEETKYVILQSNKILTTADAPGYYSACCEMKDFWAYFGDLDKNGSPEIVIASFEGSSNGMGIMSYEIMIFRDPRKFPSAKPLAFPVEEFGENGNFIYDAKRNETQILVTYWQGFNNLDLKRDYGTYLVGKWFRYQDGLLKPILEKPTLARRYLLSFIDEMNKTIEKQKIPYLWLKSKNTHHFFAAPREISKLINTEYGTIENYERDDESYQRRVFIKTDSGELLNGIYSHNSFSDKNQENTVYITDVGLANSKYYFPFGFDPFVYIGEIKGKRVELKTYVDKYQNKYTKVWLLDK